MYGNLGGERAKSDVEQEVIELRSQRQRKKYKGPFPLLSLSVFFSY